VNELAGYMKITSESMF